MPTHRLTFRAGSFTLGLLAFALLGTTAVFAETAEQAEKKEVAGADAVDCSGKGFQEQAGFDEGSSDYKNDKSEYGFMGKYQMGEGKLADQGYVEKTGNYKLDNDNKDIKWLGKDGINSKEDFLNSPEVQDKVFWEMKRSDWNKIERMGLDKYVGETLPDGTIVTESSLLHGCHMSCGFVKKYFENGKVCNADTSDAYTCVTKHMKTGSGFDVSRATGKPNAAGQTCANTSKPYSGDETSRTCPPSVAMFQGINCAAYPPSLMAFCAKYKPLQMNMSECNAAEKYAKNVPPSGPHLDACKQQTFGSGTGAWSYVLACAKAEPAPGETPSGDPRQVGSGDDPACYERLKARGIEFNQLGKMDISTGGRTCVIPNAVSYKGKAVPLSRTVTLNCALVEQLEDYGQSMAGRGVTKMQVLGDLSCRGINTATIKNGSKTSLHGTGNAIDINGFEVGGKMINTKEYFGGDGPTKVFLTEAQAVACTKFNGTLGFRYYKGAYSHLHFQATENTSCDGTGK